MRTLRNLILMTAVVLISTGCGGGGSDSGGGSDAGLTDNISGVWTGQFVPSDGTTFAGTMTLSQPVSGSSKNVSLAITGTITTTGSIFDIAGTEDGNSINLQFNEGSAIVTMNGELKSANSMQGDFTTTSPVSGTWSFTR